MAKDDVTMESVVSSNIAAVGYDEENNVLYVEFNNGSEWAYDAVSRDTYENLRDAASPGGYFNSSIKGSYSGRKL